MLLDDKHVKVENAMILWDSLTRPEQKDWGTQYKLKLGLQANNPAIPEINQIAQNCLNESKWKGLLPSGAHWPITPINPGDFLNLLPGGVTINPSTSRNVDVWDDKGNKIDPMQYPNVIYTGQIVSVVVHCWDYDNKQRGIGTGLDGVQVQVSRKAPRQSFGDGGYDASKVFGTPPGPQGQQAPPAPGWTPPGPQGQQAPPAPGWTPPGPQGQQAPPAPGWTPPGPQGQQAPPAPAADWLPPGAPPTFNGWAPN